MERKDFTLILLGSALFVAIGLSGGLFSYSPSSLPAAVSSLSPSYSPLGSFTIQNAGRVTPISITGFSLSPFSLSSLSVSGFNNLTFSSSDNLYRLATPITISPQANHSLTLYLTPASSPSSLYGQNVSLSSVSYQANNSNYTTPTSLSFPVPPLLGSSSDKSLRDLATCTPTASACDADARSRVSNLINALDNKDNISERSLVTYIPSSPENWRSIADNVRLGGASLEDLARDLPDLLRTQPISIPDSISPLVADRSYACSVGLEDSRFTELQNLSLRRRLLELVKSRGYDLELRDNTGNTSFLSTGLSACVRRPSYESGTYEDVYLLLPKGDCKTAIKRAASAALAETESQIASARLRLFTDGFIDASGLSSSTPRPTPEANLNSFHSSIQRCRTAAGELDQNEVNSLRQLYGQACEDAKQIYPQFNHQTDAPSVKNTDLDAITSTTRVLDAAGNYCSFWLDVVSNNEQGERVEEKICSKPINYPLSVNGVSCSGPQAVEQCGYYLSPIEVPGSPVPTGYIRFGYDTEYIGGACTGISNLTAYFFSNANYIGGDCRETLSEFPNRLANQCFDVACGSFQQWFNAQIGAELNQLPLQSTLLDNPGRVSWEQVMNRVPNVCERSMAASDQNSIFYQNGIRGTVIESEITNLNHNPAFIPPVLSINGVHQALYNQHFDTLDDLLNSHISTIGIILSGGAHQMFAYSCNSNTSINTFDPNIPGQPVVIEQNLENNGLWSVPTWTDYFQNNKNKIINECIKSEILSSPDSSEEFAKSMCTNIWNERILIGNNIIIDTNRPDYHLLTGSNSCR